MEGSPNGFDYCCGANIHDAAPVYHHAADFDDLCRQIVAFPRNPPNIIAKESDGRYICAPLRANGADTFHRCQADALPRGWFAMDEDEASPEDANEILVRLRDYSCIWWHTRSHTPRCPRLRIVLALSRPVSRGEDQRLGLGLETVLGADLASVKWDRSVYRGEHAHYLPFRGVETNREYGEPVDADAVLALVPPEARHASATVVGERIAAGGRDKALTSLAGTMRRRGMAEAAIYAALEVVNREQCDPPLPEADVRRIARSVGRYAPGVEREEPPVGEEPARRKGNGADPKLEPSDTPSAPSDCFVLPGNGVTISGCAANIFGELARKKTTFVRSGVVSELSATKHGHALCAVSPAGFRSRIERYKSTYAWIKTGRGKLALCPKPCSEDIAKALLASLDARELLPQVDLVLATPILVEREGRLEPLGRGYHERERLLITKGELPLPVELGATVRSLRDLLRDFLFPTPGDRSRALASVITPALTMGGLLGGYAPLDIAEATAPQSGKGYRQKLTQALYGERAYTIARREGGVGSIDESLGMALFSGKPFILIDNIRGLVDSQYLESIITCPEEVAIRIPRREEIQVDALRVTFQLTSNGAEITPDLAARSCITRIRKQPPGYKFRVYPEGDVLDHVRKNQPHYLGCVFAVVIEWYAQGKPTIRGSSHDFRGWAEALDWIVQRLFKAAPLLEGHDCAQERASDLALTWLRHVCVAAAKTNQLGVELSASDLLELCEDEDITLPRRIGTNPGDGAKAVGQVLAKLYREADGNTLAVDEYEMQRIEREEYDSVERKHRPVKRYVIQETHTEKC